MTTPNALPFDAPPPPRPDAAVPREYHQALLRPGRQWWRGAVAIAITAIVYLVGGGLLGIAALTYDLARGAQTIDSVTSSAVVLTWPVLLATNLGNALLIPCAMLTQRWLFGVKGSWIHSVAGMFRWRVLARTAGVIVGVWGVYLVIYTLLDPPQGGHPISWPFLAVVLLTTWLQSAGEEYGFRGILTRSVGSWFANPRVSLIVATLVSAAVFMLAHGAGDPWLILYYFAFGVGMSIITWRTGGLESAALLHALNNTVLFVIAALVEGGDVSLDRSAGSGSPALLFPIAVIALLTAAVWYRARDVQRTGVAPVTRKADVAPFAFSAPAVGPGPQGVPAWGAVAAPPAGPAPQGSPAWGAVTAPPAGPGPQPAWGTVAEPPAPSGPQDAPSWGAAGPPAGPGPQDAPAWGTVAEPPAPSAPRPPSDDPGQ